MNTLIIKYLPSGQNSNTRKLLEHFQSETKDLKSEVLDLLENKPAFFDEKSMQAYYQRNYGGQSISPELEKSIAPIDRLCEQFVRADIVVMAFPMHNFGIPGIVKTYFDAVMLKGKTFNYGSDGKPVGLMKGKRALVLYTSAGEYPATPESWDTLRHLGKIEFDYMGFEKTEFISAQGMANPRKKDTNIHEAFPKVSALVKEWYRS